MKTKIQNLLVALMTLNAVHPAAAQGTAFTYQGQLIQGTNPATGDYDMTFSLYAASVGGPSLTGPVTNLAVTVANGLFTVPVDFGADVFNGGSNWLGIAVRTNGGGAFTTLAPRTPVTPTPYAIYSQMGGSATNFTGSVRGDISGTQDALVVTTVGGQTAASVAQGVVAANNATPFSVPNSIVGRDTNGNISANSLTLGGALNLPYPAILNSGGTNFLMEDGSLYAGVHSKRFVIQKDDLHNTGFGDYALEYEATAPIPGTNGMYNTAVGEYALTDNQYGWGNTAVGYDALEDNQAGYANTAVGYEALMLTDTTNGNDNTALGFRALWANSSGGGNTANGTFALLENETGSNNTAIGLAALEYNTGGYDNTASGFGALTLNETGFYNTADGVQALYENQSGSYNTASGAFALYSNTSGGYNAANGFEALDANTSGSNNTANGFQALYASTIGTFDTADGFMALWSNTNGAANTANGSAALFNNTSGSYNTAEGFQALYLSPSAGYNTAIGSEALYNSTGSNNIALGYGAGSSLITGSSNIYIGNPGVNGDNHAIRIGDVTDTNTTVTVIAGIFNGTLGSAGIPVEVDAGGHLGVRVSSAKFKHDIQPMGDVSDVLLKLKPVTFKYNADRDPSGTPEFGLVAEQVNEVDPDLVVRDGNHQIYSVRYEAVNAMLLNEFLKQHQTVQGQSEEIADLKARLKRMEQILSEPKAN
jgi:hypothetical protein